MFAGSAVAHPKPRTFASAREAAEDIARLSARLPVLVRVYRDGTLDRTTRERVMVAVSRVNTCAGCTVVHEQWALRAGVTPAELEAIGLGDLVRLDDRSRAAIIYAAALAEARFRAALDEELLASVRPHLTSLELRSVEAVTRLIALANLVANGLRTRGWRRSTPAADYLSPGQWASRDLDAPICRDGLLR